MTHTHTTQKAAGASNTNGLHTDTTGTYFRTDGAINQAHDGKAIATQLAHLATAGHIVHKGSAGDFTVCKYGMTRYCKDFTELQAFARQLGVTW
jgi:hypothetical protein